MSIQRKLGVKLGNSILMERLTVPKAAILSLLDPLLSESGREVISGALEAAPETLDVCELYCAVDRAVQASGRTPAQAFQEWEAYARPHLEGLMENHYALMVVGVVDKYFFTHRS